MEAKVLVYQAYGVQDVIRQTIFSIVSLLKAIEPEDTLQVWIYTDQKNIFTQFFGNHSRLRYIELTMDQINSWRGKIDFVHRVKIEILKDAAARFKGCLYYCDGDTYFMSSPSKLYSRVNDRYSLMHIAENALDRGTDPLSKKVLKFVKKHHFQVNQELVGIGPSTVMWNAGVLGLSEKNKSLLPDVLELTDQSYSLYRKHVMEQLAFSFFLQTHSEIIPANDVIYHYWNQKAEYQTAIDQFLKENGNLEKALEKYPSFPFPPPPKPKKSKTILQKILRN